MVHQGAGSQTRPASDARLARLVSASLGAPARGRDLKGAAARRPAELYPCEPLGLGGGQGTLIVIDDDSLVLSAMQRALESWGYFRRPPFEWYAGHRWVIPPNSS